MCRSLLTYSRGNGPFFDAHVTLLAKDNEYLFSDSPPAIRAHLVGLDLRNSMLSVADLSHATLSGIRFSGADLSGSRLVACQINQCTFDGADLTGAFFNSALIAHHSTFVATRLDHTRFDQATIEGALFTGAQNGAIYLNHEQTITPPRMNELTDDSPSKHTSFFKATIIDSAIHAPLTSPVWWFATLIRTDLNLAALDPADFTERPG